jgi:hypothetical protein
MVRWLLTVPDSGVKRRTNDMARGVQGLLGVEQGQHGWLY